MITAMDEMIVVGGSESTHYHKPEYDKLGLKTKCGMHSVIYAITLVPKKWLSAEFGWQPCQKCYRHA